jgi:hypothetical protein
LNCWKGNFLGQHSTLVVVIEGSLINTFTVATKSKVKERVIIVTRLFIMVSSAMPVLVLLIITMWLIVAPVAGAATGPWSLVRRGRRQRLPLT